MFKLVCRLYDSPLKKVLMRFRLYHPPLQYLTELSEDNAKSIDVRSQEFSSLLENVLINGTWKRTGVGRLVDLDKWVIEFFPPKPGTINMLEIGGSDGSTTYDTLRYFRKKLGVEIKASIIEMNLRLHFYRKGCVQYYLTHDWKPLLLQIGIIGVLLEETKNKEGFLFNPLIRFIKHLLKGVDVDKYFNKCDDILFKNPAVRNCTDIEWLEQSVFEYNPSVENTFDYIRCCNVLNNGYFESIKISEAVNILTQYLKPDGLLLIARAVDISSGVMHTASLWRKSGQKMVHVSDLNGGSEVKKNVPV